MPRLTIRSETGEATSHDLVEEAYTIGRAPENSIRLEDYSVSGRHAELVLARDHYHLKDLGSTNGTLVNGRLVTEIQLRPGDVIVFGKVEACFECEVVSPSQRLPVVSEREARRPAELSARPADFANASPFQARKTRPDPARTAAYAVAMLAMLAFLASMIALVLMRAPTF